MLLNQSNKFDTILLACTHYPLLINKIKNYINGNTKIISQGEIVANSLKDYLLRHPEINALCKQENKVEFFTTDNTTAFNNQATTFWGQAISSIQIEL
ncbi:MAG: hypothetical protein AMXMBFR79_04660 [Chitinophagaceae bacterium]